MRIINSFEIENEQFYYFDIMKVIEIYPALKKLPIALKILLEMNLRHAQTESEIKGVMDTFLGRVKEPILFLPSRVIMDEMFGIQSIVDILALRDTYETLEPKILFDCIVDTSVQETEAFVREKNEIFAWAQKKFVHFRRIDLNAQNKKNALALENLSTVLHIEKKDEKFFLYPETTIALTENRMGLNALGTLGIHKGEIQTNLSVLGFGVPLTIPRVIGCKVSGFLANCVTSSDILKALEQRLMSMDLQAKIVEFYGEGLKYLSLEDRSRLLHQTKKMGVLCSFFPVDYSLLEYYNTLRGSEDFGKLVRTYLEKQSMFFHSSETVHYDEHLILDLSTIKPFVEQKNSITTAYKNSDFLPTLMLKNKGNLLKDNDVVLVCINEKDIYALLHASLVAKKAHALGYKKVESLKAILFFEVNAHKKVLEQLGLLEYFLAIGFEVYHENSVSQKLYALDHFLENDIVFNHLNVCSLWSYCKIFDTNGIIKSHFQLSSSLLVGFSLVGNIAHDIHKEAMESYTHQEFYFKDLWPSNDEMKVYLKQIDTFFYQEVYKEILHHNTIKAEDVFSYSEQFVWNKESVFIQPSFFLDNTIHEQIRIENGGILALLGDNISTNDISPMGQISLNSTVAKYLNTLGIKSFEYATYQSRATNANVMLRGLFDSDEVKNAMVSKEGGYTIDYETQEIVSIYDKALQFKQQKRPTLLFVGENFGQGIQNSWAVKGLKVLGVDAVIAKSYNPNYRMNLIAYGILPLEFIDDDIQSLKLKGNEAIHIVCETIKQDMKVEAVIVKKDITIKLELKCRLDTQAEVEYYKNGGIFSSILKHKD